MTLWQNRLEGRLDDTVMRFTESLSFDVVLAPYDISCSKAHVKGLATIGILTADEESMLIASLDRVAVEMEQGIFEFKPDDEDIHTAIERRVTELAGDAGSKLHTGRSRNDQVATDLRLYTIDNLTDIVYMLLGLEEVLLKKAIDSADSYMPGYTHLQRAQPIPVAHHFLAHGWALTRDVARILSSIDLMDVSPLGAGALAGSSIALDPNETANLLHFSKLFENSLDAVADRDFVADALYDLAIVGLHLSRIGEETVLWSSNEFGFVTIDDSYATGSSMLPHKKNPDVAELARGKSGRLIGNLTGLLATLKGLPLAYNRDLQEDKQPLFDSVNQLKLALPAMSGMISTMVINQERMAECADSSYVAAIDLAEWLVSRNVPFRTAHGIAASLVKDSITRGVPLLELVEAHPQLGSEATELLSPGTSVNRRVTWGSASPDAVRSQLERFRAKLEYDRARLEDIRKLRA
jgi:argininosuccinate lyase